jgi:hypothetical protein
MATVRDLDPESTAAGREPSRESTDANRFSVLYGAYGVGKRTAYQIEAALLFDASSVRIVTLSAEML